MELIHWAARVRPSRGFSATLGRFCLASAAGAGSSFAAARSDGAFLFAFAEVEWVRSVLCAVFGVHALSASLTATSETGVQRPDRATRARLASALEFAFVAEAAARLRGGLLSGFWLRLA